VFGAHFPPSPVQNAFSATQGGIIYKAPGEDEAELLASDIQKAGAGECSDSAVKLLATEVCH
jgi:aspartate oxidase